MELVDIILSFIGKVFIFIICLFIGIRLYCIMKFRCKSILWYELFEFWIV